MAAQETIFKQASKQASIAGLRSFGAPFYIVLRDNKGRKIYRRRNSIDLSCDLLAYHSGPDPGALYRFHIEQAQA